MTDHLAEPLERLREFFKDMTHWEASANEIALISRADPRHEPLRKRVLEIQRDYCTPGAKFRGYDVEIPPTYSNIKIQTVEQKNQDEVVIKVCDQKCGLNDSYEFVLVRQNGRWLLSKRVFVGFDGKKQIFYF